MIEALTLVLASSIRLALPLAFAACGEYIAERSGTINISIEAMMLGGAFSAVLGASATGSPAIGLVFGVLAGLLIGFVHANFSHRLTVNTYVVGLTLNLLVLGLTSFMLDLVTLTPSQVTVLAIPLLSDIPVIGPALFAQRWPAYLLWLLLPAIWYAMYRTRWGLQIRASGENPSAVDATGIDVNRRRREGLLLCGLLSGLGGAYLAVGEVGMFNQNMTSGRGYVVIAAVIFGAWTLRGAMAGCLVFGAADAMRLALPALGVQLNPQLLIASPYILALLAMVLFARSNRSPSALGQPFTRGLP
ncbi:ABC transporter permease [Streptosporangium sp. NPDC051022]|uniref:ABC transporter permease n=1 Tax=Streptosporangium sp. NPDC051022 TaxID=3155752 RepID=UPI00341679EF